MLTYWYYVLIAAVRYNMVMGVKITSITNLKLIFSENSFKFLRVMYILFVGKCVRVRNYATEIRHFLRLFLLLCRHFTPLFLLSCRHFPPLCLLLCRHFPPLFLLFCRYLYSFNASACLAFSLALSKVNIFHNFSK